MVHKNTMIGKYYWFVLFVNFLGMLCCQATGPPLAMKTKDHSSFILPAGLDNSIYRDTQVQLFNHTACNY